LIVASHFSSPSIGATTPGDRDECIGLPGARTLYMLLPQCFFCKHLNPTGAKFCNDCGSPLHLKPCSECEAINDQAATNCYRCGKDHPVLNSTVEAPAMSAPSSATESIDVPSRNHDDVTAQECEPCVEIDTREARSPDEDKRPPLSGDTDAASLAEPSRRSVPGRRRTTRAAAAGLPSAALLAVLGVSAFYAYLHPSQLKDLLSAKPPWAVEDRDRAPTQSTTEKVGPELTSPVISIDPGTAPTAGPAAGAPDQASTEATGASGDRNGTLGTGAQDAAAPLPPPSRSPVDAHPAAATIPTAPGEMILRAGEDQVAPKDPASGRMVVPPAQATATQPDAHPAPRDARAGPVSRVVASGCSEAAAAIGQCSAKKTATAAKTSAKKSKKAQTKKVGSAQAPSSPTATVTPAQIQTGAER
jgi:ribosomal protein L40E